MEIICASSRECEAYLSTERQWGYWLICFTIVVSMKVAWSNEKQHYLIQGISILAPGVTVKGCKNVQDVCSSLASLHYLLNLSMGNGSHADYVLIWEGIFLLSLSNVKFQ